MSEVIVCPSAVIEHAKALYQTVCTFSMSREQMVDLFEIEIRTRINAAPHGTLLKGALTYHAAGMLAAFTHVISTEHCEVVCKGADGAIHKGANSAGTGLRWKGTDFLFTPIEVQQ